jgi:hypothetical protein
MPKRITMHPPDEKLHEDVEREAEAGDRPEVGLVRRLMKSADEGKTFLWIWSLIPATLVALSVATFFSRGRPNGLDFHFSWSG